MRKLIKKVDSAEWRGCHCEGTQCPKQSRRLRGRSPKQSLTGSEQVAISKSGIASSHDAKDNMLLAMTKGRLLRSLLAMTVRGQLLAMTLLLFTLHYTLCTNEALANNISVSSGSLGTQDQTANTEVIQFNISWENSWRDATNYDAAWVFIKYSVDSGATWAHATLKTAGTNPADTNIGSGTGIAIIVPTDKKGAFIQRSANGTGTLSTTSIQLTWDYGTDLVTDAQASHPVTTQIRIMAIEMVYIPTGSFDIGDGNATTESTNAFHVTDNTKLTIGTTLVGSIKVDVNVYDDDQIEGGAGLTGIGIDGDNGIDSNNDGVIDNANFPTGYNAFYIMKYGVSQGQWVDFFNTLTATQKATRDITGGVLNSTGKASDAEVNRNTISWTTGDAAVGANQYVACNFLSWMDVAAYADWAGLRPMTELEYEKASRGPTAAVNGEYAWGSTSITQVTGITNGGAANETATNSGNCAYGNHASVQGPMRCGFAATATTTRAQAGASYYGVMEFSGNNWKRAVTVGNSTGRAFTGTHGDGSLSSNGNANNSDWPGYVTSEVTGATGSGFRGGDWINDTSYVRVSDRTYAANTYTDRHYYYGGRCARTP